MDSRKKAKNGAARSHQQRAPSIAITSAPYTSSYMIVQEQSPPLSSPPPFLSNSSSSKRANELLNDEITSRSGPSRPSTKHGRAIQSTAPERSVAQSQETAGDIISNFPGTIPPPVEPRVRPKASCSEKANSTLQTTKLVKVLANNKALLFDCMSDHKDENDEDCKKIMRKISAAVKDDRFQTWPQIKLWTKRYYRRLQGNTKSLPLASSSLSTSATTRTKTKTSLSLPRNSFEKNLVPLLKLSEMTMNAKTFLNSVIEAIGTRKLAHIFRHQLPCDELPADIGLLIFSPLYVTMCERETRKRKLVRNRHNFESDSSDDEWSDWEEVPLDEGFNGGDPPMTATGAYPHILPSIEEENDDSRADDLPETPDPVTEKRADKPSTPIRIQEPEICATQVKVSRKARRRIKHDKRRTRNKNVDRRRSRILASSCLSNACDGSAHRPAPNQLRVQNRAVERTGARKGKSLELPSPSAPKVRPFIDFMSPAATVTPDPDTESLFRMKGLLCDEHGRSNSVSVSKASRNLQRRGTTSTRKNTATKDRDKDVATANARNDTNPHTVQPVRGTPLILIEENERQARKLAMPLVPTKIPSRVPPRKKKSPLRAPQVHREVRPKIFYSSLTRDATVTPRENPEAQVGGVSQPKCPEHTRDAAGARSGIENEENRSKERRKGATPDNIPRRRSLSHQSYRSNDTFPSIEELYRREIQKRTTTTQTQPQSRTHTQIQPETTGRKGNDRKRPRGEPSSKYHDPSTKRSKIAVGPSSPVSSAVAEWAKGVDHANSPINDTKRKRVDVNRSRRPSPLSMPKVPFPTPRRQKRWRNRKPSWRISSRGSPGPFMPIGRARIQD